MYTRKKQLTVILVCLAAAILSLVAAFTLTSVPRAKAESVYIPDIENTVLTSAEDENAEVGKPSEQENDVQPYSADIFRERKIVDSGKPDSESIVLTFMGDGFTENEQGLFIEKVTQAVNYLIGTAEKSGCYPFSLFADYFTVYAIEVISNESGVSRDCDADQYGNHENIMVDNYFGSSFYGGNDDKGLARATVISEEEKARSLAKPNSVATVVLCNSGREGGAAKDSLVVMTLYKTELRPHEMENTLVHELGHVCGLEDEYYRVADKYFRKKEAPNCSKDPNKWAQWNCPDLEICSYADDADYSDVSDPDNVKPDPESEKWYKPSTECKMEYTNCEFCPVCTEALISAMENKIGQSLFEIETSEDDREIWIKKLNIRAKYEFKIPSYINGKPVTRIEEYAFADQTQCTAIILPKEIKRIDSFAFRGCSAVGNQLTISNSLTYIGDGAFYGCNNVKFIVPSIHTQFYCFGDIIYNKERTVIKIANSAEPFGTISESVAPYAFAGNERITNLTFEGCSTIGERAFADCYSLATVDFDSVEAPTVGNNVFANCASELAVYVPYKHQSNFKSAFGVDANRISSRELNISLCLGDSIVNKKVFVGGDIDIFDSLPDKTGYTFGSWYDNPEFAGDKYTNTGTWMRNSKLEYYAEWIPKQYTVTLDPAGGTIKGGNTFPVTYGRSFSPDITAERDYHVLQGWYLNGSKRYMTADGKGTAAWDIDGNATLKAVWTPYQYEVKIDAGTWKWLGATGVSEEECLIPYGTEIPTENVGAYFRNIDAYKSLGQVFKNFKDENGNEIEWATVPALGDNGNTVIIIPVWEKEKYRIVFETECDSVKESEEHYFDDKIMLTGVSRTGYTFKGWYDARSGGNKLDWTTVPDLTPNAQSVGVTSVSIYAQWEAITYFVKYDPNGGVGTMENTTHVYGTSSKLRVNAFTRTGYIFSGWATSSTDVAVYGNEQSVVGLATTVKTVTLYAYWTPITYRICYNSNGGAGTMSDSVFTYGRSGTLRSNTFTRVGNVFLGWSLTRYGNVDYGNCGTVINLSAVNNAEITLYAVWDPIKYTINFGNLADGMKAYPNYYYYDDGLTVLPRLYYKGSSGGRDVEVKTYAWYNDKNFTVMTKPIRPKTKTGNITMYAEYEYMLMEMYDNGATYTVTDRGIYNNPYINVDIYLKSLMYDKVKNTTLNKIKFEISFNLWEVDDGYQHIYLFDNIDPLCKWSKKIDHTGGKKRYTYTIELDLEANKDTDLFQFRFDASGWGSDTWKFDEFTLSVNLTN